MAATHGARRSRQRAARGDASQIAVSGQFARPRGGGIDLSFVRVADDRPLVEDAAFPWLARDTPFGRNCYIFAEGANSCNSAPNKRRCFVWWLLSVLALCGMPALRADVCDGLQAGPPKGSELVGSNLPLSFKLSVGQRGPAFRITVRPIWQ